MAMFLSAKQLFQSFICLHVEEPKLSSKEKPGSTYSYFFSLSYMYIPYMRDLVLIHKSTIVK